MERRRWPRRGYAESEPWKEGGIVTAVKCRIGRKLPRRSVRQKGAWEGQEPAKAVQKD